MRRRQWDANTNALSVSEGLKGQPVAPRCPAHQSRQALSEQWRDPFLAQAANAVDDPPRPRQEARRQQENPRRKPRGGELTLE